MFVERPMVSTDALLNTLGETTRKKILV